MNYRLLGVVDIDRKRYARLQGHRIYCLPWIDAFAELVGEAISVLWSEDSARTFRVSDADGIIEDDEDEAINGAASASILGPTF